MMRMGLLALDIGKRKTGIAYGERESGFVVALETLRHRSDDELIAGVKKIALSRSIDTLIIGLPLLLDGSVGEQATYVRTVGDAIGAVLSLQPTYIDERFSNAGGGKGDDATAACAILSVFLDQQK